jgi:hypothetical protein
MGNSDLEVQLLKELELLGSAKRSQITFVGRFGKSPPE